MKLSDNIVEFVITCRGRFQQDMRYDEPYKGTVIHLVIDIEGILVDKKNRKLVLLAITGFKQPVISFSQKNITQFCHEVLINEIETGKWNDVIKQIEQLIILFGNDALIPFGQDVFPDADVPWLEMDFS